MTLNLKDYRAIAHYATQNGLTPQLSIPPTIFFKDKKGNTTTRQLVSLRAEFDRYKKEHRKD